MKSTTFANITN